MVVSIYQDPTGAFSFERLGRHITRFMPPIGSSLEIVKGFTEGSKLVLFVPDSSKSKDRYMWTALDVLTEYKVKGSRFLFYEEPAQNNVRYAIEATNGQ